MLLFEPGLGNIPTQYTTLLEDLASQGFIVFAITPTYSADLVVFPDGHVATATPAGRLPGTGAHADAAANRLVTVWAQDVIFVINQLDRLNVTPGNRFHGHLDMAHLGLFGHSFGGTTAAEVCHIDARCKAGIDLDGRLAGDVLRTGLTRPFIVVQSDRGTCAATACRSFEQQVQAILRTVPRGTADHLGIKNTGHFNFSDYAVELSYTRLATRGTEYSRLAGLCPSPLLILSHISLREM